MELSPLGKQSFSLAPPQLDLFGEQAQPAPTWRAEILTLAEEEALICAIDQDELAPFAFQQWTGKRLTRNYGWQYDFKTGAFGPAEPIPRWLAILKERAARFACLQPNDLAQALLTRYDPGAGIGWHKDRSVFDHVVGISLGAPAVMRFRRRTSAGFDRFSAPLAPRSIYHLSGELRDDWEHSIVPIDQTRWSITFRSLR